MDYFSAGTIFFVLGSVYLVLGIMERLFTYYQSWKMIRMIKEQGLNTEDDILAAAFNSMREKDGE